MSRIVTIDSLGDAGRTVTITANDDEREAVRQRLGLEGLKTLSGTARVERKGRGRFRAYIDFRADVLQSCVVTLEPVASEVSDTGVVWFQKGAGPSEEPELTNPDDPDPPEPLVDGRIDVGELIVQHLSLALDPYPRAVEVDASTVLRDNEETDEVAEEVASNNAFAALAKLKRR